MDARQKIRQNIRKQRRALTLRERDEYAEQLAAHFTSTKLFRNARRIALYLANDGELDPVFIQLAAESMGKTCYLPVLLAPFANRLMFARYNFGDALVSNCFGIGEPVVAAGDRVSSRELDLVLMPLVAFDDMGNRIGMGGGFYDRTFSFLSTRTIWRKPALVGLAYGFQEQKKIPHQSWDVPLHYVATENQLISIA